MSFKQAIHKEMLENWKGSESTPPSSSQKDNQTVFLQML